VSLTSAYYSPCDDKCFDNFRGPDRLGKTFGGVYCDAVPGLNVTNALEDAQPRYECLFRLSVPIATDPNIPTVTAVSDLGFNGGACNTSAGASAPTSGAAIMKDSDPAVMAANGIVTPSPIVFVGRPGPGGNGTSTGTAASTQKQPQEEHQLSVPP
jgi:hypothetical protein